MFGIEVSSTFKGIDATEVFFWDARGNARASHVHHGVSFGEGDIPGSPLCAGRESINAAFIIKLTDLLQKTSKRY